MIGRLFQWRSLAIAGMSAALAACAVVPKGPPPRQQPTTPQALPDQLPTDTQRHRIALLVPMTGQNAAVGQSIANAATMALLDTNASNLRVTTYDTAVNPGQAAQRAIADGNKLILGPLLSENIQAVLAHSRPAKIPLISFSNDQTAASRDAYIMGNLPRDSVDRSVSYAIGKGVKTFAALVPRGEYGQRASDALMAATRKGGATVQAMEAYDRSNASITAAARKLREKGGYSAVLIADGGRMAGVAAPILKPSGDATQIIGTELWSGEKSLTSMPALSGAWFSAVSDNRFGQFSQSYKRRYGATPYRISTLGYDAVLLTLRIARDWQPGTTFPTARLADKDGFLGLDGAFRFDRNGAVERAMEVREIKGGAVVPISPASTSFAP